MRFLILGSKEYPVGSSALHDTLPSGGMERYVQELAGALQAQGHVVHIVTRDFGKTSEEVRGIQVHRVGWIAGFFLRNPSFNLNSYIRARHLDYDVAISNGVFATLAALALRHGNKKPVIARPAGVAWCQPQYPKWAQALLLRLERFAYKHADSVVFPNLMEKQAFQKKIGFTPAKCSIIPTGVNLESFNNKASGRYKKTRPTIVFLGRLQKVKGVEYLIKAVKDLDATLLIIGSGPQEAELKRIVKDEKMKEKVRFLGNRSDVPSVLSKADVFALPSLSEGLPLALLEAWAASLPAVVTDIGLPVIPEKDALVVPPCDAEALKTAIKRVILNPSLAKKLGKNGRQRVEKNHSWKKAATKYAEEARRLCAE